ncbi:DNA-binding transcriptional LysR family regulator [Xanthomonas campestris]|uniref:LysR family transcriptional regulator n=1 Tax=Xanthomonas sp. CFBP 8151 TaxID=3035310 RepID=UPI00141B4482|nr:LysR family transcriptional regulator [Xanthomonas sp. CFBP 8151]MEB1611109.1 LysR family transcriptional regulator [Xanthomonas campestris pv. campestris]NIJ75539.1 DNA-binding transcriptional LysR family regulator [Xanthomonas sp. CFBP 8151]
MPIESFNDALAFVHVVREGSFTRAAALLGVSPSALSHAIRGLEGRLGVRLLTRTTRSIATTEAGEHLFCSVAPRFEDIDAELRAVRELRDKPMGTIRITTAEHAANSLLWPKLSRGLRDYPEINVEITVDYAMADIVSQRYDAGVRLGDQVAKDMIAVRIGPDQRIAVVGTPRYFADRPVPRTPHDLLRHNCINLRLPTHGGLLPWDFEKEGQEVKLRVAGQWVFNNSSSIVRAVLADQGLAYVPEDLVLRHVAAGRLIRVLDDWCDTYTGYHLYYPSRRESSRALAVVVEALRHRDER